MSRGPFGLTGDLVAGFWLIKTKSLDEAIDWMKRAPFDGGSEIEIRQVFSSGGFWRSADAGIARAGRAPARPGREEVRIYRHSGTRVSVNPESGDCCARFPDTPLRTWVRATMKSQKENTDHAIHDADDPLGL